MDISFTVCFLFVCTVTDFPGKAKASGIKFCTVGVLGRKSPILRNIAPPEAQNQTNQNAAGHALGRCG